ncbi:organic cation transporter protein [Ixodes scapularis]
MVYYGFARSSTTLDGNPFINFAIVAAIEGVGYTISLGTTKYLKRVPVMAGSYGFFGVTLVDTAFTPKGSSGGRMADVVDLIGNFGRWQGFFVAFVTYRGILTGLNNMAYVFLVTNNDHWCSYPDKDGNMTGEQLKKMFIPYDNVSESYSQCLMYDVPLNGTTGVDNATTVPCDSWIYDEHVFGHSVSNEWDLVCERKWQKSLVQSSYMGCLMLGVIIIGNLSDRYGRRIVALWSSILLALSSVACVFSNSFYFFLAARVGIAFGISGLQVASFSLLAETIGPKSRIALNICYGYGWIAGILLLPGIVWLVEDWRKLYIVNSVLGVSILVMLPWLYESPRWLLSTGQKTKACASIKKIAKFNRRGPQDIEKEVERLMETKVGVDKSVRGKVSTAELFKTKYLRRNTILLTSCSFFSYIVYYGFARSSTTLGGNPFITFAITAAIETVGYTMSLGSTKYLKRIPIMAGSYGFFGVTLVATALTPKGGSHQGPSGTFVPGQSASVTATVGVCVILSPPASSKSCSTEPLP